MPKSTPNDAGSRVAFGDVVQLIRERTTEPEQIGLERYVGLDHIEPSDLKIRRWGDVADGTTFTNVFRAGHVLFGKRRAYQRKVAVADFDGVCSGDIYVLAPRDERLLPDLLPFICQTERFFAHAIGTSAGSLSPRTNWENLATYEFVLPPIEEQQRTALLLSVAEAAHQRTREAAQAAATVVTSWFHSRISKVAPVRRLGDVLLSTEYGCSTLANIDREGVPILRIPNVLRGELDLGDLKWVRLSESETAKYTLRTNDILIVRTNGNPDYVGRCLVIPPLSETMVFASYLIRLVVDSSKVHPEYVASVLNSPAVRSLLRQSVRSSAGNFNINTAGIRGVPVPIPSLAEQDLFLNELHALNAAYAVCQKRARELKHLQSLVLERLQT